MTSPWESFAEDPPTEYVDAWANGPGRDLVITAYLGTTQADDDYDEWCADRRRDALVARREAVGE